YLPLDPSYPRERLDLMIEDSGVALVLRDGDEAQDGPSEGATPPEPPAGLPDDRLAYCIYTSGSTGRPKGVLVGHRGLANLAAAQAEVFGLGPADRVLQFAPASFDASVFELAMALSSGAALVLACRDEVLPGPGLAALLARERVSCLTLPPSVLAALPDARLPDLSTLICAGEALPADLAARWGTGRRLFNAYGPTETTVWATVERCRRRGARPPIGRAIPGHRVAVVGPDLRPVAPGEPGELVVGGAGVTRGYHGRPALTAERFVPDPWAAAAGERGSRLYRTGDRARELADGRLEFLGRVDHQVKIRGHRVEPGEAEAALASHPAVRAAAVVALPGPGGEPCLVAHAVAPGVAEGELRAHLARRLPEHLRPARIVLRDELPLLPNGKVDRAALAREVPPPEPAEDRPRPGGPPRTEVEAALAGIWRDLLGVARPGRDDDFFELGGHSLLAGRLISRVRRGLGAELPPRAVFEGRTLAAVARAVEEAGEPPLPPVERAPRGGPLPLTFPQERIWFLEELSPGNVAYNSQVTVRFAGPLSWPVLARALSEVLRRHEAFRSRYFAVDGRPWQEPLPARPAALPVIDLRRLPEGRREAAVEAAVRQEGRRPFALDGDAERPPLVRWRLLVEGEERASLLQVEHHFVHDGWAFAVVLGEIRALYEAFAAGRPSPLPEPLQIGDVAAWQRRHMSGERLREHLAYWTGRLAGAPTVLELPADRPRPPAPSLRGGVVRLDLPSPVAEGVRALARERGVTLFSVLLAGFAALLSRVTGEDDLVVGSGNANRRTEEAEGVVGMLVNTLALRLELAGEPTVSGLLSRVTETLLGSQAHQDMPLDRLIDALGIERDPSRNPLVQVLFSFHDSPVPDMDLPGVRGRVIERHNGTAKTDLNVVVVPRGEQRVGRAARAGDRAITLIWEYATDLFDRATMARMVGWYQRLLAAAVAAPGRRVAELELLAPAERAQLLG
ncbi:MAG TPA: amino acid adenylation domain-containing protein, partial [Thermoanaerobaculia bacterium]